MTSKEFRIVMTFSATAFALLFAFMTLIAVRTGALTPGPAQAATYTLSPTYYYTATVPGLLSYQGTLADGNGDPIDGNVAMTFRIYTTTLGGTPLYTETHPAVVVRAGDFAVLLGDIAPFPDGLFAEPNRYLSLQVGAQAEMAPRQRFASVAFALEAGHAKYTDIPAYIASGTSQYSIPDDGIWHDDPALSITKDFEKGELIIDMSASLRNHYDEDSVTYVRLLVDGTEKIQTNVGSNRGSYNDTNVTLQWLESIDAGEHTIKVQWMASSGRDGWRVTGSNETRVLRVIVLQDQSY